MRTRLANPIVLSSIVFLGAGVLAPAGTASAIGNTNGIGGVMPAYYDHNLLTINFMQLTTAQNTLLAMNEQQNIIYQSDPGLPGGAPFISVINAIPTDGFNPLWAEVQIAFTPGHTPHQFFSDDEINAAAAAGEITLTPTNEMYRCSVIGAPPVPAGPGTARSVQAGSVGAAHSAPTSATPTPATWGSVKRAYR